MGYTFVRHFQFYQPTIKLIKIMRQFITALFLVICGAFCAQNMYADNIPTKGKWGPEDIKSIFPARPTASIEGQDLTIEFTSPLSNLTIQVKDNTGMVVYEECVSASGPQVYTSPLNLENGEYTLELVHRYGYLTGSFIIETE